MAQPVLSNWPLTVHSCAWDSAKQGCCFYCPVLLRNQLSKSCANTEWRDSLCSSRQGRRADAVRERGRPAGAAQSSTGHCPQRPLPRVQPDAGQKWRTGHTASAPAIASPLGGCWVAWSTMLPAAGRVGGAADALQWRQKAQHTGRRQAAIPTNPTNQQPA